MFKFPWLSYKSLLPFSLFESKDRFMSYIWLISLRCLSLPHPSFFSLTALGLSCGIQTLRWDPVSWPGIKPRPLALGAQSFSHHHITREVPLRSLLLGKDTPLFSDFFVITILLLLLLKKPDHPFSIWIWPTVPLWWDLTYSLSSGVPFSWLSDLEP